MPHGEEPVQFGLDGEMIETNELTADSDPGAMQFVVGPTYEPTPDVPGGPGRM